MSRQHTHRLLLVFLATLALAAPAMAVSGLPKYVNYRQLRGRLADLASERADLVRAASIGKSAQGRHVWLVEVGAGPEEQRRQRPAVLIVAGIEGNDIVGSTIALAWIEHLLESSGADADIAALLETTTIYIMPRVNPDSAERFFAESLAERSTSDKCFDDDHDGLKDEDGPEDINGDGLVTWMRVEDKQGRYILDPKEERLLIEADHLKGEVGAWRYLPEGIDNDDDEKWNEDGPGGVNFNRNFPYNYKYFGNDAGVHQISESETRALADFVIDHPNIALLVTYGAADNLLKTPKSGPAPGRRKPATAIDERDIGYYKSMGKLYRDAIGLEKELQDKSYPGTFGDWMYFHRGRLSLAVCPWNPELAVAACKTKQDNKDKHDTQADETAKDDDRRAEQKKDPDKDKKKDAEQDKRNEKERKWLKWFDEHAPDTFLAWEPFEHPDFPGQRVEVGGYHPFALTNPPVSMLERVTSGHVDFLTKAAQKLPRIAIRRVQVKRRGRSVYEVEIQVENTGFLPTTLAHGRTTQEVYPTRLVLDIPEQFLLSGERITRLGSIQGSGGMAEARFVIYAPYGDRIRFDVISMLAGRVKGTIRLRQD